MKKSLLVCACIWFMLNGFAQGPGVAVSFHQIFDNREYYSAYAFPQTIFGARLDAAAVFALDSMHSFSAGFNYLYENGSSVFYNTPTVNLHYSYTGERLEMAFGAFPRDHRINFPLVFLNDTLNYYRPSVEGALVAYEGRIGSVMGFADWTGRVSETMRERFMVGLAGKIRAGSFFAEPLFLMAHDARSYAPDDSLPIRDNGALMVAVGYALQQDNPDFSLTVSGGFLTAYNRFRPQETEWGRGMLTRFNFRYSVFGLKGVYYFGSPVDLVYGDPFYRSGNYGRLDIYADPFRHKNITSKIGWNLHLVPGEGIHHSQQILISVKF